MTKKTVMNSIIDFVISIMDVAVQYYCAFCIFAL